mgnify:CR=1 FL=1
MLNGFYAVRFQSPVGMGGGVIFLNDGSIKGGDSTIFYHGTYEESGETFTSDLKIDTHLNLPGHTTVFGIPKADLKISGTITAGKITGEATSPQAPGITMGFVATKLDV